MINPPGHETYRSLCEDPDENPLGTGPNVPDDVAALFSPWLASTPAPLDRDALLAEVLLDIGGGPIMNGGIGVFVEDASSDSGTLQVLHGVRRHPLRDNHRGQTYAYLGDVQGVDITVVGFLPELLDITAEVRVAMDADQQMGMFAADEYLDVIPAFPVDDDAVTSRSVQTRKSMYIPYPLIPYVLDRDLTAKQALTTLIPVIQDLNLDEACGPLIDFLIVATTATSECHDTPVTVQIAAGLQPGRINSVQSERRSSVLHMQLPGIVPTRGARSDPALTGIMRTMQEVRLATVDDLTDRRLERDKVLAPKTISERWPSHVDRLCKMCGVDDTDDLPAYWHEVAALKKTTGASARGILQDSAEIAAAHFRVPTPHVTVQHANSLQNWTLAGSTEYNLAVGILPFTVTPTGAVSLEALVRLDHDHEQTSDYTTILDGNASMTASDARALRANSAYIPVNMDETEVMLNSYGALLGAVLGHDHPNVLAHFASLEMYTEVRLHLKSLMTTELGGRLAAATLLYYYHAKHRRWFTRQWRITTTATIGPPNFSAGFDEFAEGYNLKWLPSTKQIPVLNRLALQVDTAPREREKRRGRDRNRDRDQRDRDSNTDDNRSRIKNRNRDPRFLGNTPLAKKIRDTRIRDAIEKAGMPDNTSDTERCMCWHIKGECFTDCRRVADHKVLDVKATAALFEWCKIAYE